MQANFMERWFSDPHARVSFSTQYLSNREIAQADCLSILLINTVKDRRLTWTMVMVCSHVTGVVASER